MDYLTIALCAVLLANILYLMVRLNKAEKAVNQLAGKFKALFTTYDEAFKSVGERLSNLEKGTVPSYEEAKKAADAVNDFSRGISNLLGFDPYAALHKDEPKDEA